jgi:protein-tyrosine-phosphatase
MKVLIVFCTSNTCRSPMLEALTQRWVVEHGYTDIKVESRGITEDYEPAGSPASQYSVEVIREAYSIDITKHRSKMLTDSDVETAFALVGVTVSHANHARHLYPAHAGKIFSLKRDVSDPWHSEKVVYERCAQQLAAGVEETIPAILSRSEL